jgi:hypothetical protein
MNKYHIIICVIFTLFYFIFKIRDNKFNIPNHSTNATRGLTTWGPDFEGEKGYATTESFHIMGPFLDTNHQYGTQFQ